LAGRPTLRIRESPASPQQVSAEVAQKLALDEYEKFERRRLAEEASAPDELEEAVRRLAPEKPARGRPPD
jgi:hypothetical protein